MPGCPAVLTVATGEPFHRCASNLVAAPHCIYLYYTARVVEDATSLLGPVTAEAEAATRTFLVAMHLAVTAVLIPGLGRAAARQRP